MKLIAAISIVVAFLVLILASIQRQVVWQYDTTQLFWSKDKAYVFVTRRNEGWSGSLLARAWETSRGAVGFSGGVSRRIWWLEVFEVTAEKIARWTLPSTGALTPLVSGADVYAVYQGKLSLWSRGAFIEVAPDRKDKILASARGGEFTDENWSSLYNFDNRTEGRRSYQLSMRGTIVDVKVDQGPAQRSVSVQLPGKPEETLIQLPVGPAWVTRDQYEALLQPPPR